MRKLGRCQKLDISSILGFLLSVFPVLETVVLKAIWYLVAIKKGHLQSLLFILCLFHFLSSWCLNVLFPHTPLPNQPLTIFDICTNTCRITKWGIWHLLIYGCIWLNVGWKSNWNLNSLTQCQLTVCVAHTMKHTHTVCGKFTHFPPWPTKERFSFTMYRSRFWFFFLLSLCVWYVMWKMTMCESYMTTFPERCSQGAAITTNMLFIFSNCVLNL